MSARVVILLRDKVVVAARLRSGPSGWALLGHQRTEVDVPTTLQDASDLTELAQHMTEVVRSIDGLGESTTLIIPAGWCYAHTIELPHRRVNEAAAGYQLEEFLPVPLEEVTCTFARNGRARALGIALPTRPMRTLLDKLSAAGVCVERIVPDILCAAAASDDGRRSADAPDGPYGVMIRDAERRILSLQQQSGTSPEVIRTLHASDMTNGDGASVAKQIALTESCHDIDAQLWSTYDISTDADSAVLMAAACNHKKLPNLAHAALAPTWRTHEIMSAITRSTAILAVFLISLAVYLHVQHARDRNALAKVKSQITELYQSVFPGGLLPPSPSMRLASERIRLQNLTRQNEFDSAGTSTGLEDRLAPLSVLQQAATQIPRDVRVNILELSVDEHQLAIRGHTGNHRDAERIAEAINRIEVWTAKPPRTSRLKTGGVEFSVRAVRDDAAATPTSTTQTR